MTDCSHSEHCPFLNRADARCARHFSLDQLQHTFEHCFGQYEGCGVYRELLQERRLRRASAAARLQHSVTCTTDEQDQRKHDHDAHTDPDQLHETRPAGHPPEVVGPVVQLTVFGRPRQSLSRGLSQRTSRSPVLSDALGV
jgi:hypothetical protein